MKKTMSLVLALMLVAAVLTGCGGGNSTPEAVVTSFFNAAKSGNLDGIISCLTPDMQEMMNSALDLAKSMGQSVSAEDMFGDSFDEMRNATLRIDNVTISGNGATVTATAIFDGNEDTTDIPCVNVDGKWYIDGGSLF